MDPVILALNAGSSSLKATVFRFDAGEPQRLLDAVAEGIGSHASLKINGERQPATIADPHDAWLALQPSLQPYTFAAVGHRIVHGGLAYRDPIRVDDQVLRDLDALTPLAPLHQPAALRVLRAVRETTGDLLPHVVCFDTAFHRDLPQVAYQYPFADLDPACRKFGFHGLAFESVVSALPPPHPARIILAHLGNGASLAALLHGRCIDTSMGLTPTGGILMGTRSGDLDPGLLIYLMRQHGWTADDLEVAVNRGSGLKALSGGTSDMRDLVDLARTDPAAQLAIDIFCHRITQRIGAYIATLGGLDLLVFSGGIGENSSLIRRRVTSPLAFLPPFDTRVVAADEGRIIAQQAVTLLFG